MKYSLLGSELSFNDRRTALAMFVHHFTAEHKPEWANRPRPDGTAYPVQFASDADWLAHTRFATTKTGKLDTRSAYCESSPTWPNNPELRGKF